MIEKYCSSLYITYDGLLEPLGQSQILPYVERLAELGIGFWVLSFEKPSDLKRADAAKRMKDRLGSRGIEWIPLRYHKSPSAPATAWDALHGLVVALWISLRHRVSVVHARSYVPALIGAAVKTLTGSKLIFDMRGFWPEERVDGNLWRAGGRLYRAAKWCEGLLLGRSDSIVVLTNRAKEILLTDAYQSRIRSGVPVTVIPCCTDVSRFRVQRTGLGNGDGPVRKTIVYAGSVGTWYMLDEMLDFFRTAQRLDPELHFLILNRHEPEKVKQVLSRKGFSPSDVTVAAADFDEMPTYLARAFAGMYFITPAFSKVGSSPTKLAEYLAAGVPVIVSRDIGDSADQVSQHRLGVVVNRFDEEEYRTKWVQFVSLVRSDGEIRSRCRQVAAEQLSMEFGMTRYGQVYEDIC